MGSQVDVLLASVANALRQDSQALLVTPAYLYDLLLKDRLQDWHAAPLTSRTFGWHIDTDQLDVLLKTAIDRWGITIVSLTAQ